VGQKTHPLGFRLGVIKTWRSRWYAGKSYADTLHEDLRLRRYIKGRLQHSGVSRIEIERKADQIRIIIHTARPASSSARRAPRSRSSAPSWAR